jgi:hypothetical protein
MPPISGTRAFEHGWDVMGLTGLQKRGGLFLPGAFIEVGGEKPASLVKKQRIDSRGEIFSSRLGWILAQ